MKINPIGVQSYQRLTQTGQPPRAVPGNESPAGSDRAVTIAPHTNRLSSLLAVTMPNAGKADALPPRERAALQLVLKQMHHTQPYGPGYGNGAEGSAASVSLGRIIDVKV
jgi:hypothetical protein